MEYVVPPDFAGALPRNKVDLLIPFKKELNKSFQLGNLGVCNAEAILQADGPEPECWVFRIKTRLRVRFT